MALVSLNLKPSDKQLREFGIAALVMCAVLGGLLFWKGTVAGLGLGVFCAAGVVVFVLSRVAAGLVRPIYLALIVATFPIGWVISHAVMAIFYYVIIGGTGLVFKLIGRDPLCRKIDRQAESYWVEYKHHRTAKDYFHQF